MTATHNRVHPDRTILRPSAMRKSVAKSSLRPPGPVLLYATIGVPHGGLPGPPRERKSRKARDFRTIRVAPASLGRPCPPGVQVGGGMTPWILESQLRRAMSDACFPGGWSCPEVDEEVLYPDRLRHAENTRRLSLRAAADLGGAGGWHGSLRLRRRHPERPHEERVGCGSCRPVAHQLPGGWSLRAWTE